MDSKLEWKDHVQRIQQKATNRLTALSSLASSTWGASLNTLRQVYQAMILPQMLYRCSAWYRTRPHRPSGKTIHEQIYDDTSPSTHTETSCLNHHRSVPHYCSERCRDRGVPCTPRPADGKDQSPRHPTHSIFTTVQIVGIVATGTTDLFRASWTEERIED